MFHFCGGEQWRKNKSGNRSPENQTSKNYVYVLRYIKKA